MTKKKDFQSGNNDQQIINDAVSKGFERKSTYQQDKSLKELPQLKIKKTKTIKRKNNYLCKFSKEKLNSTLAPLLSEYSGFHRAMHSCKQNGQIYSYGVNCYKGIYRDYNEDRVCIFFNIAKPRSFIGEWPNSLSIFGIFDGHGGKKCAEFLRDNLHLYLIHNENFPSNMERAIQEAFDKIDEDFLLKEAVTNNFILTDNSGSCANVCIIADSDCYIANVGDSRAFISKKRGTQLEQLSFDHKPDVKSESRRIRKNKGKIYKSTLNDDVLRILPGNLAVSRAFGNASSKIELLGGKKNVIISTPDIIKIKLDESEECDYIFMGCDGIYDKLTNEDVNKSIWETLRHQSTLTNSIHDQSALCADLILKTVMSKGGTDNVTAIVIGLKGLSEEFEKVSKRV